MRIHFPIQVYAITYSLMLIMFYTGSSKTTATCKSFILQKKLVLCEQDDSGKGALAPPHGDTLDKARLVGDRAHACSHTTLAFGLVNQH